MKITPRMYVIFMVSVILMGVVTESLLVARLLELRYLDEVYDKLYPRTCIEWTVEEGTRYQVKVEMINNTIIIPPLTITVIDGGFTDLRLSQTMFQVNISLNALIVQGAVVIRNISFQSDPTESPVYLDYTLSTLNTTIDTQTFQTYICFLALFKTSDIARSLGITVPFWLT